MPSTTIEYPVDRIIDEYDTDEEGLSDLIHSIFDDDFGKTSCNADPYLTSSFPSR